MRYFYKTTLKIRFPIPHIFFATIFFSRFNNESSTPNWSKASYNSFELTSILPNFLSNDSQNVFKFLTCCFPFLPKMVTLSVMLNTKSLP